jgi:predicted RecB family nuclease
MWNLVNKFQERVLEEEFALTYEKKVKILIAEQSCRACFFSKQIYQNCGDAVREICTYSPENRMDIEL